MGKLLEPVRDLIQAKHYSRRTEAAYLRWIKDYITFHKKFHRAEMRNREISRRLTHLAVRQKVAASTDSPSVKKDRQGLPQTPLPTSQTTVQRDRHRVRIFRGYRCQRPDSSFGDRWK